jgi:hypothetical protein
VYSKENEKAQLWAWDHYYYDALTHGRLTTRRNDHSSANSSRVEHSATMASPITATIFFGLRDC